MSDQEMTVDERLRKAADDGYRHGLRDAEHIARTAEPAGNTPLTFSGAQNRIANLIRKKRRSVT